MSSGVLVDIKNYMSNRPMEHILKFYIKYPSLYSDGVNSII